LRIARRDWSRRFFSSPGHDGKETNHIAILQGCIQRGGFTIHGSMQEPGNRPWHADESQGVCQGAASGKVSPTSFVQPVSLAPGWGKYPDAHHSGSCMVMASMGQCFAQMEQPLQCRSVRDGYAFRYSSISKRSMARELKGQSTTHMPQAMQDS
jgi:hypothetical protein